MLHVLWNISAISGKWERPERNILYLGLGKTGKPLLIILGSILTSTRCYKGVKIIRLLSFSNEIQFYFCLGHLGHSYSNDRYSFCDKTPLAITAINAELPPFNLFKPNDVILRSPTSPRKSKDVKITFLLYTEKTVLYFQWNIFSDINRI